MRTLISAGIGGAGGVFAGAAAAYTPGAYSTLSLASALREWGGDSAGRLLELGKKAVAKSAAAAQNAAHTAADALATGARVVKGAVEGAVEEAGPALRASRTTFGSNLGNAGEVLGDAAKGAVKGAKEALGRGAKTTEASAAAATGAVEQPVGPLYRAGGYTKANFTPRVDDDALGLSTFTTPERAAPKGGKVQILDPTRIDPDVLVPVPDPAPHVSIRPPGDPSSPEFAAKMKSWATEPGKEALKADPSTPAHTYTEHLMDARIGEMKVKGPPQ